MTGRILIQFPLLCHVLYLLAHSRISIRTAMHGERKKERKRKREKEGERERFRQRDTSAIIIPREIIIPAIKRHPGGEGEREAGEGEARRRQQTAKCLAWQVAPFFQ